MSATANHVPVDLFRGSIFSAFADVLSQVSGQSWKTEAAPAITAEAEVEVGFQCQGTARGPFAFRMSVATAVRLAKLLMGEPVPEGAGQLSGDDREALEELLRQVVGIAATRAEGDFGKLELSFVGRSTAAPDDEQFPFSLAAEGETLSLQVCVGKELLESLALAASESTGAEPTACQAAPSASAFRRRLDPGGDPGGKSRTFMGCRAFADASLRPAGVAAEGNSGAQPGGGDRA